MVREWALAVSDGFSANPQWALLYLLVALPVTVVLIIIVFKSTRSGIAIPLSGLLVALLAGMVPINFGGGTVVIPLWVFALWAYGYWPLLAGILLAWTVAGIAISLAVRKLVRVCRAGTA